MTPREKERFRDLYRDHVRHLRREYDAALETSGYGAVVLHSGSPRPKSEFDDQYWPLRLMPHFAHWVPLEWAECALICAAGKRPRLVAFRDLSYWERPAEPPWDHFRAELDVAEVTSIEAVAAEVTAAIAGAGRTACIAEDRARAGSWGFEGAALNPEALLGRLDALRTRKTDYEIACLSEATRRAAEGHEAVAESFWAAEVSELQLHLLFLSATGQDDSQTPYKNIVALGANAAILHHVSYERTPSEGARSLLIDAGASCMGYASDITRTYVETEGADGSAAAFAELVARMNAVQQSLCAQVRVGMNFEALHDQAHREIAVVLRDLDIVRLPADEMVARGVTRAFFPHGLGHSLGIQTHDVGCLVRRPRPENPWLRNTSDIAPRQVLTIEPGVYFIDSLLAALRASDAAGSVNWTLVDALRPFGGVRIEDNVVVLEPGGEAAIRNVTREHLDFDG
jgi:Xaa-Pro dipeptidase